MQNKVASNPTSLPCFFKLVDKITHSLPTNSAETSTSTSGQRHSRHNNPVVDLVAL